jgi:TolB-like protein
VQQLDPVSRPSLAVLPFRLIGDHVRYVALASALPDELITELSRLRWLLVTARGSSFRLRTSDSEFGDIGRLLRVRY